MTPKLQRALIAAAMLLVLAVLQVTIVPLISIGGVIPSFLLIGAVFVSLREGQMTGMLAAFPAGLLADAYLSALVGITPLGLTFAAFAAGFFHDEEKAQLLIRSPRAVLIVFLSALLFHLIYVFAYFQSLSIDLGSIVLKHILGASLYTMVVSAVPVLILSRRISGLKV